LNATLQDGMTTYSTLALVDLLDAFSSNDPVPGGGSASALAGSLGVSLLLMVAGIPRTRTGAPEETADLAEASARLRPLRETLMGLIDADADAYGGVMRAFKLPKASDAEKLARRQAVEAALHEATQTPLETMRACQQALRGSIVVGRCCAPSAKSDASVGVELLLAAVKGSGRNVETNVHGMKDASYVARVTEECRQLRADSEADARAAWDALRP
jgi:formiminotetrahydrofolate cyclodeaminase